MSGKPAAVALEKAGLECNYNSIPFDPRKPFDPSGIRIGTPAVTTRGMKEGDMGRIAQWMDEALSCATDDDALSRLRNEVHEFCTGFPLPA